MNDVLRQIDDQILDAQLLLEKLQNARDIVYGIVGDTPAVPEKKPAFTVRRVKAVPRDAGMIVQRGQLSKTLRVVFIEALRKYSESALNMDQLREEAFGGRKPNRLETKVMQNLLSKLAKDGTITRISPGLYSITKQGKVNEEAALGTGEQRVPVPA